MSRQATRPDLIGGRYLVSARIGSGGMGEVFRALDQRLGRQVAVKVLPEDLAARPGSVERFLAEAKAAGRIATHPNVVHVYDSGEADGAYYLVMEYVRGRTLREVLASHGSLAPAQAGRIMAQVLSALEAAHATGVVHRDIKPENVLVTDAGEVKVTDFGIASVAEGSGTTGDVVGTVTYAAPEQIQGAAVDGRADLYAAGIVLYELLCAAPPFEGPVARVLQAHLTEDVPAPSRSVPAAAAFDAVVAAATAIDPAERYASATAMRADVEAVTARLPAAPPLRELAAEITSINASELRETLVVPVSRPRRRRRRWPWAVAVLVLASLVAAGLLFVRVVPAVTGLPEAVAEAKLVKAGFGLGTRQAFSDQAPGTVLSARSPAGILGLPFVFKGGRVSLTVSKGPDLRQEPDVATKPLADAEAAIRAVGLDPVESGSANTSDPRFPAGTVLSQNPPPGAQRPGTPVNLTVSKGPQLVAVPAVTGTDIGSASSAITGVGLTVTRQSAYSTAVSGTVISQDPAPGAPVPIGSAVTVVISKGAQPFPMPNVVGQPCSAARAALQAKGLQVAISSPTNTCASNKVLLQDPLDGLPIATGGTATLYVP